MAQIWPSADYAPRNGQDSNAMYSIPQLTMPHYTSGSAVNYLNGSGSSHYSTLSPSYSNYSTPFIPNQHASGALMYMSAAGNVSMPYQMQPPPSATLPSQPRSLPQHPYYSSSLPSHRLTQQHTRLPLAPDISLTDTEDQESIDPESLRSEPVTPALDGYPKVDDFDDVMKHYVQHLSPKKQDKALIHAKRAANIKAVLVDKKQTSVESAQFRFWVKKMFTLEPKDLAIPIHKKKICHEGKPVAIREKLFKILTKAHKQCQHGGRDKTSSQVRRVYSWVPKELISRFVKLCPTCQVRRGTSRTSAPSPGDSTGHYVDAQSPESRCMRQPIHRSSTTNTASGFQSPIQMSGFTTTFQQQNRWMTPLHQMAETSNRSNTLEAAASAMINMNMNSPTSPDTFVPASSKLFNDPGTPYMSQDSMQLDGMDTRLTQHGFSNMHGAQGMHRSEHRSRIKRSPIYKREHRY